MHVAQFLDKTHFQGFNATQERNRCILPWHS